MGAFLLVTTACSTSTTSEVVNDQEEVSSDSGLIETPLMDTIKFTDQQ